MKDFELHIIGNERQYHIKEYAPVPLISRRVYSVLFVPIDDSRLLEPVADCDTWQEVATAVLTHQAGIYKAILGSEKLKDIVPMMLEKFHWLAHDEYEDFCWFCGGSTNKGFAGDIDQFPHDAGCVALVAHKLINAR